MISIERPGRFAAFVCGTGALVMIAVYLVVKMLWGSATIQHSGELIVAERDTAAAVWQKAVNASFTSRTMPWRFFAWRRGAETSLRTGAYALTAGENVGDVIERLVAGSSPAEITITFPEGFTLQQMAARTAAAGLGTADEFLQAASPALYADQFPWLRDLPPGRDLEGYLFPDTYLVFADDKPADVIKRLLATFQQKVIEAGLPAEVEGLPADTANRSLDQAVMMASIVEREVQSDTDMVIVAGILWQRLDDNVGLAADATVRYALDKWDGALTQEDLQVDSPYNTRRYAGLPPGPISNPGLRALIAAVKPQASEYYYYLSAPSGETIFSRTLAEHNANKAKYLR